MEVIPAFPSDVKGRDVFDASFFRTRTVVPKPVALCSANLSAYLRLASEPMSLSQMEDIHAVWLWSNYLELVTWQRYRWFPSWSPKKANAMPASSSFTIGPRNTTP